MTRTKVVDPATKRHTPKDFSKVVWPSGKPAQRVGKKPGPVTYVERATPPWPKPEKK